MELKLNIYNKDRSIEKTYRAEDYAVMHGVVEDLLDALDIEALTGGEKDSMLSAVSRLLRSRKDVVYPLLKDIFEGLTDDELRRTTTIELVDVIISVAKYSLGEIQALAFRKR